MWHSTTLWWKNPQSTWKFLIIFTWIKVVSILFQGLDNYFKFPHFLKNIKFCRAPVFCSLNNQKRRKAMKMYHSLGCCHCLSFLVDNYYLKSVTQIINDPRNSLWKFKLMYTTYFAMNVDLNNSNGRIYLLVWHSDAKTTGFIRTLKMSLT